MYQLHTVYTKKEELLQQMNLTLSLIMTVVQDGSWELPSQSNIMENRQRERKMRISKKSEN